MRSNRSVLEALARAFLTGGKTVEAVADRATHTLGRRWRWIRPLAKRYIKAFSGTTCPQRGDVVQFLRQDIGFQRACLKHSSNLKVQHWPLAGYAMRPVAATRSWKVPKIESTAALARWLGTDIGYLEWFADLKGLGYKTDHTKLRHYHYRVLRKDSGGIRLIEAPKQALKKMQQKILGGILDKVPAHLATHGFVRGRSIKTFVAPHTGQRVVLRIDLRNFFPTFRVARIRGFFRTLGYPESVANLLAGICTAATPRNVWERVPKGPDLIRFWEMRAMYARSHLPQGAPTSPALANLCSYRLDCRLAGLAAAAGARYTRYADDLAFSGDAAFEPSVERFSIHAAAIAEEEGFAVNHRKTRIMRQGLRQRLAGIVANRHPNIPRRDFDRLKAILTNCVRHGSETQNREAHPNFRQHLEGKVTFVEMINPEKGRRLRTLFRRIDWA